MSQLHEITLVNGSKLEVLADYFNHTSSWFFDFYVFGPWMKFESEVETGIWPFRTSHAHTTNERTRLWVTSIRADRIQQITPRASTEKEP